MRRQILGAVALAVLISAGCTAQKERGAESADGIPQQWVDAAAEGYPTSDGYQSSIPILGDDPCVLQGALPEILGESAQPSWSG